MNFEVLLQQLGIVTAVLGGIVSAHSPTTKKAKVAWVGIFCVLGVAACMALLKVEAARGAAHVRIDEFGHAFIRPDREFTVTITTYTSGTEDVSYSIQYVLQVRKPGDLAGEAPAAEEVFA